MVKAPFDVREEEFPRQGPLVDQHAFLLRYAILAPSTHNTQPWRFAVTEDGVRIYADYGRRLPVVDPGNRELLMSIGAAVFNLRVAASHFGFACTVHYNLSRDSERPLASVSLSPGFSSSPTDPALESLFPCIVKRHTNRNPFLLSRIPASVLDAFNGLAVHQQPSLVLSIDGGLNQRVGELVAAAERTLFADPTARKDLAEWVRPNWTDRKDGMTGAALGINGFAAAIAPWATRTIDLGRIRAAADRNLCIEAPALIVVQSEDATDHWLESGELLEKLLLTITREGLHCSYFNMPIQVTTFRPELRSLLGLDAWPQLLLRVGYCLADAVMTPRRPVEEVMVDPAMPPLQTFKQHHDQVLR